MNRFIEIFKNNLPIQNLASWLLCRVPPMVEHNLEKYGALRKAFYLTELEALEGDYLEFGVFTGSSFVFASRFHRAMGSRTTARTRFFGFDSFDGFGAHTAADAHPFYVDETFKVDQSRILKNIFDKTKGSDVKVVPGYFEQTLTGKTAPEMGIEKIRIAFIDCDMKEPCKLALEFLRPAFQPGSILILDDALAYKGSITAGVTGAFQEFQRAYPELRWRHAYDYGMGGKAFICHATETAD